MAEQEKWQKAFIDYAFDAAIGRHFKGLIHNLNGVGQAFSMQTELLSMMFDQAESQLESIENSDSIEFAHESAAALKEMLAKRSSLTVHLVKEVRVLYDIMKRCSAMMEECRDPGRIHAFKLRELVGAEVEFLCANSFFKHKVSKELVFADNIPALSCYQIQLHNILSVLIENSSQSMEIGTFPEGDKPKLDITTSIDGETIRIDVEDNGPGVSDSVRESLFAPFVSGSNRLGLGLYLAGKMAEEMKGSISFTSSPGRTCFSLLVPLLEVTGDRAAR